MAVLAMDTNIVLDRIGSEGIPHSALGCISQLLTKIEEIENTARTLDAVWDDEAQRIFMNRFVTTSAGIKVYLSELKILTDEIKSAAGQVSAWDESLKARLGV
jgi:hypothetical protein